MFNTIKRHSLFLLGIIFLLGILIRLFSVYPYNIIIGFDQARDLFEVYRIYQDFDLKIIGPTAGNNPNMHHGILYLYYILLPLAFSHGNPMWAVVWNIIVTSLNIVVIYLFSKKLFQNELSALISAFIMAVSNQLVQFSGWLSNPSPTTLTVPLVFLGLWMYHQKNNLGLVIAAFFLGLSIQFELFFIYLIPITCVIFLALKIPLPNKKTFILVFLSLVLTLGTMILTELKYNFGTIKAIINSGNNISSSSTNHLENITNFTHRFNQTFEMNLLPGTGSIGEVLSLMTIFFLSFKIIQNRYHHNILAPYLFLLLYLLSPSIMLILGYHSAPWFLIALPGAIALSFGRLLTSFKYIPLILLFTLVIIYTNIRADLRINSLGQTILEPDPAALVTDQVRAIDYTYQSSNKQEFSINTLTNPLYINAVWAYDYMWYGQRRYGFLPSWAGGDQIYPYNTLRTSSLKEQYLYLLIDQTDRIPMSHKLSLIQWADEHSKLLEEKSFGGVLVQKRALTN